MPEHLRPHANAEQRCVLPHDLFLQQWHQPGGAQPCHTGVKCAIARENQFVGLLDRARDCADFTTCTQPIEHVGNRAQIADLIVHDHDHARLPLLNS